MSYTLTWMPRAKSSFFKNINYLEQEWNDTVIKQFLTRVERVLTDIRENPFLYPFYKSSKKIRRCVVNERIVLFYRVTNNTIELLLFWNTYQSPHKLRL